MQRLTDGIFFKHIQVKNDQGDAALHIKVVWQNQLSVFCTNLSVTARIRHYSQVFITQNTKEIKLEAEKSLFWFCSVHIYAMFNRWYFRQKYPSEK